jgi:hypothetical protein
MWIPITTETDVAWLKRVSGIPLLGAIVSGFFSAWPATLYVNVAEAVLQRQDLPVHTAVGFAMAGAWSAALWFKYCTKITILWIPSFCLWPVIGVLYLLPPIGH